MLKFQSPNIIEVGVDECARGVLFGRLYSAAVIYPKDGITYNIESIINDSKQLSIKKRNLIYETLIKNLKYSVSYIENNEIDEYGIQICNYKAFHNAIDGLNIKPDKILVDGRCFKEYYFNNKLIEHECIVRGDGKYLSIACASIIAKVEHDRYIIQMLLDNPYLEKYNLSKNMGYGTEKHINAIKEFGYTKYHRKSFKIKKLQNII